MIRSTALISISLLLLGLSPSALANNSFGENIFGSGEEQAVKNASKRLHKLDAASRTSQSNRNLHDKWALLIGVNHFQDNWIKPLKVSRNNVLLLAATLKEPTVGKFPTGHVAAITGRAAHRDGIIDAIFNSGLIKKALPQDLIILYFATRIMPLPEENDICLCTYDTLSSEAGLSGLKFVEIMSNLRSRTQCPHILCILDCSPVTREEFTYNQSINFEDLAKRSGVSILTASQLDQDSHVSGTSPFSDFTLYLTEAMRNSSGVYPLSSVMDYIQENLAKEDQAQGINPQTISFAPASSNIKASETIIGMQPKSAWNAKNINIGHSPRSIAYDRPDLLVHTPNKTTPNQRKVADEDPEDANFFSVNYGSWMEKMQNAIKVKWISPKELAPRHITISFIVAHDGVIGAPAVVESSGEKTLDQSALDALKAASPLDPLPKGAPDYVQLRYSFN